MIQSSQTHPSSYEQVREILERIKAYHLRLREQLHHLSALPADSRDELIRESMFREQQKLADSLENYVREGDPAVLETWIQYVPLEDVENVLVRTDLSSLQNADDLVAAKAQFDQELIQLLRHLARETSVPRVQEVFEDMARQAERAAAQQSWRLIDSDLG